MKKWGQHFLVDKAVAEKEVRYAEINKRDIVLEIGPGRGILTELLAKRAKKVIAVEIDKRLVDFLKNRLPPNVELVHADVMRIDLSNFHFNKVVSNLPFQISSPLTLKLLDYSNFSKAVLIYQKEFARRLAAGPGSKDYSRISVVTYYKAKVRILEDVSKYAFRPVPKVDGAIVELIPRDKPAFHVEDESFFYDFLRKCFSSRRKSLGTVIKREYDLIIDEEIRRKRIEELYPEEIGELCNWVYRELRAHQ